MNRSIRFVFSALLIAVAAFAASSGVAANAATLRAPDSSSFTTAHSTVTTVVAKMTLNCSTMPAKAKSYAVAHGYCLSGSARSASPIPDATATGNCGTSQIYIIGDGNGRGDILYGFDSTKGTVIYRNLGVAYGGEDASGGWNDASPMFSSHYSRTQPNVFFGHGDAWAVVGGTVTLWWGASCTLLVPDAETFIE